MAAGDISANRVTGSGIGALDSLRCGDFEAEEALVERGFLPTGAGRPATRS
ncbi:hypothetical protein [Streptomyces sp. WM4235]|uniref:hypothetical protein n=1 Tax=Streptomyces sp. WM4235 TaxID=1415551 RepID=UPI000B085AFA|nr:hypothetical protein [Streptomyces sp. WM4235]